MMRKAIVSTLLVVAACGSDGNSGNPDSNTAIGQADAFVPPADFTRLVGGTWSLNPGQLDTYKCVRFTVQNETFLTNIIAEAPFGSHHTVLSISDGSTAGPDGPYDCSVGELGMVMLYASGVGTSPLDFPAGVGVRIPADTQIHLNLHLFNATDDPISGESAIWVKSQTTAPSRLAEMVFAGQNVVIIPSNNQNTNIVGTCTASNSFSLFAIWPHMHQIANHQKFELTHNSTTTVLHDQPYTFLEQNYYLKSPEVQVAAGDQLRVTCTYRNNTGSTVITGDGSNEEMCFSGMYRYPATGSGIFECTQTGTN